MLEVCVPEEPVHALVISGLFSVTVQLEVYCDVQLICDFSPDFINDGLAVMLPVGGGGALQALPEQPQAQRWTNESEH